MIKKKDLSITNKEKHDLVTECIEMVGEKFGDLVYKHDGCRILQAMLKYGQREQRKLIAENLKGQFVDLMQSKYAHYLASKLYYYAPEVEQKQFIRSEVQAQISKLILHQYASEVIEYIYC